jgi:hypothetical protein
MGSRKIVSAALRKIVTQRVLDDFMQRSKRLTKLQQMAESKAVLSAGLLLTTVVSLCLVISAIERRLARPHNGPDSVVQALRCANLAATLVGLLLTVERWRRDRAIRNYCQHHGGYPKLMLCLRTLLLCCGFVPPFVDGDVPNPPIEDALPMDAIGLLIFLRLVSVFEWAASFSNVSDPVLLSYRHGVEVHYSFQVKYFMHKAPVSLIAGALIVCTLSCAYLLHVLEYFACYPRDEDVEPLLSPYGLKQASQSHFALYIYTAWDVVSGLGWGGVQVHSVGGHVVSIFLSIVGLVAVAYLTATFCSFSELDAAETMMLRSLDKRALIKVQRVLAARLIQHSIRKWRIRFQRRKKGDGFEGAMEASGISSSSAAQAKNRLQLSLARRRFHRLHLVLGRYQEAKVANMKVLSEDVRRGREATAEQIHKLARQGRTDHRQLARSLVETRALLVGLCQELAPKLAHNVPASGELGSADAGNDF